MFFKKRKSRKQLLQEIEELEARKNRYVEYWREAYKEFNSINRSIKLISATCITHNCESDQEMIKDCLCSQLAKEIMPYVSFETYKMAEAPWTGEYKHFATVHIVEK